MNIRNTYAYILAGLIIAVAIVALLGIWEIIDWMEFKKILEKSWLSLVVIGVTTALVMLVFNLIYKQPVTPPAPPKDNNL